jgi:prevent-host-death family protein
MGRLQFTIVNFSFVISPCKSIFLESLTWSHNRTAIDKKEKALKQMPAGAFKTHCHTVMKQVQATGEPVVVTKREAPIVKIISADAENIDIFGFMAGRVKIVGDIESPIPVEWEVLKR